MTLYGIFSQFSSQKSRERIMFVGRGENLKKLYDEIPEKYLPEDLGGEIKAANQKQWVKRLEMVSKQVRSKWGEDCNLFGLSNCQFLRSKKTFRTWKHCAPKQEHSASLMMIYRSTWRKCACSSKPKRSKRREHPSRMSVLARVGKWNLNRSHTNRSLGMETSRDQIRKFKHAPISQPCFDEPSPF